MQKLKTSYNPLSEMSKLFNKLGSQAQIVFPQIKQKSGKKKNPGWNRYVRKAQKAFKEIDEKWRLANCPKDGELAYQWKKAKDYKKSCIYQMKSHTNQEIANSMCDSITAKTKEDRSKAWKPLRAVIRGNTCATTPVLNGLRTGKDIVEYWPVFFKGKLGGHSTRVKEDHPELTKLDRTPAEYIVIKPSDIREGIKDLNTSCAYYDIYTAKLLKYVGPKFDTFMALMLSKFINMSLSDQNKCLETQTDHFFMTYIRPIVKSSSLDATIPKSYRPISVSHTLTMLVERVLSIKYFNTVEPPNFYGYVPGRSCQFAVKTLKNVARSVDLNSVELAMLDASGAFESVIWEKIFPILAEKNNPRIIKLIWQMYRSNRYECRWGEHVSKTVFYATKGTKQGGVLSGKIFLEYMNILNSRLSVASGIKFNGLSWNSLFYADDVCLIGKSVAHLQQLLNICQSFEDDGFVKWNASKSVIVSLTSHKCKDPPQVHLTLNGEKLVQNISTKYLGYHVNQRLDDSDQILNQSNRLYAITNNIANTIPIWLLEDSRLRKIISAYGGIYMLEIIDKCTKEQLQKLKNAHRYLTERISQFRERSSHWNPDKGVFDRKDRFIYGRLRLEKFQKFRETNTLSFDKRYSDYLFNLLEGPRIQKQ